MKPKELRDKIMAADPTGRVVLPWNEHGEASVTMGDLQRLVATNADAYADAYADSVRTNTDAYLQGKISMVTERGDAITGNEFERERRLNQRV